MSVNPTYESRSDTLFATYTAARPFPLHLHEYLEMLYVLEGECVMTIGAESQKLRAGEMGIAFPNAIHGYGAGADKTCEGMGIMAICHPILLGDYMNPLTRFHPIGPFLRQESLHGDVGYAMKALWEQSQRDEADPGLCRAYTQLILAHIMPRLSLRRGVPGDGGDLSIRAIRFLSQNYTQPMSLAIVAEQLGISRTHLSRIFSRKLHTGFIDYVNTLRINAAQNQLLATDKSILEIGLDCGFESQRTFNRVFQKICSVTPRQFRLGRE